MRENDKEKKIGRRNFLGGSAIAMAGFSIGATGRGTSKSISHNEDLNVYNVTDFGILGDGSTLNTGVFQNLINECSKKGGGTLFFPPGDFLTGTFELKDNVNVYLSPGSTILGSKNKGDYTHKCLVYAEKAKNISITGRGVIDGNGESFWGDFMRGEISFEEWSAKGWRPEWMLHFIKCDDLLISGVTIQNSPSWTIHPIDCSRVTFSGMSILNGIFEHDGPNTDGINPDGCSGVVISDCFLQCGDDCIVLKITEQSETKVCRDVVVTNCVMITTETALKIGTETHGEFMNITFSNCTVHDSGGGFGLLMRDGGLIDGVVVDNITVDCKKNKPGQGIYIWSHRRYDETPFGMIRNIMISNMTILGGGGIFINGVSEKYIEGITLDNIRITIKDGRQTNFHRNPPYPFTAFGHHVAPYDIFCRFVNDLTIRNIKFQWPESEDEKYGSSLRCWSVKDLNIDGFVGRQSLKSESPAISLKNVEGVFVHNCRAPEGTGNVLGIDRKTKDVTIIGNEFSRAKSLIAPEVGISNKEVFETANHLPKQT